MRMNDKNLMICKYFSKPLQILAIHDIDEAISKYEYMLKLLEGSKHYVKYFVLNEYATALCFDHEN